MTTTAPSSHRTPVLDSHMHHVEMGEGQPIVHLHGNPTSSYLWRRILPSSARYGRAIAPDLIGFGQSGKPDLAYRFADHERYVDAFMDALALDGVVLVLHDWGGALGLSWARRHAHRVRGIVVMEAVVKPVSWSAANLQERLLFKAMRHPRIGDWLNVRNRFFLTVAMPRMTARTLSGEERDTYLAPFHTAESRRPIARWPREIPFDGEPADVHEVVAANYDWFKTSAVPKLLLHADPGMIFKTSEVALIADGATNLTIRPLGKGLHYVQEDVPEAINNEVGRWLADLPS